MKTTVFAAVGLVVGLAAGYLIWGRDAQQAPPSRGEWPMVPCLPGGHPPGMMVSQVLDEVTNLAMAVQPPTPDSQYCAVTAQSAKSATPPDEAAATQHVHNARTAAVAGDWGTCRRELDMVD